MDTKRLLALCTNIFSSLAIAGIYGLCLGAYASVVYGPTNPSARFDYEGEGVMTLLMFVALSFVTMIGLLITASAPQWGRFRRAKWWYLEPIQIGCKFKL